MMHLTEAVAKRETGKYKDSNFDTKENIIRFLERNGFERVTAWRPDDLVLMSKSRKSGKAYCTGEYMTPLETHWIRFYSPEWENNVFFCRDNKTIEEKSLIDQNDWSGWYEWAVQFKDGNKWRWSRVDSLDQFRTLMKVNIGI
jgi:hypothetical protein